MTDENQENSSLGVERLSIQPEKPAEIVKIDILLNAVGNSPIMKQRKWTVDWMKDISWVSKFIHKYLKLDSEDKLFLYINQTFAPSPDQILKNLYECYGSQNKLSLHYSISPAWG
ncbi:hypothetical protein PVAND_009226 [Polypedilum vanderplanki]|uniref:Ubiquitin-like protein ATG12 n=1 Tax=Polypedilum vanderplanki TaxID=319348 RepID=A0A9J6CCU8_POLVA|nr:hypothetical protein PVAND_009226 [Polypedilum vanderplanki]